MSGPTDHITDGTRMVKRVIGLPGDLISVEDNHLFVKGQPAQYGPADPAFAAIRTAAARSAASSEAKSSSVSRPAVVQSPVIANASASRALTAVAPK